ncbi:hypothetical protein EN759_33000 [Mesorhizobium sp. M00.F.Ca.ET.038.03.1.1]|nr:hypothetical protein EN759_33000 [Mesorhizobium sp. M00.F.Ca.ET.038.03.1.1]TIT86259.1 MAG: hypothetical protein E5W59_23445 [Mesorhizobium sp.]TIT95628.1 MAG: hypothetical protein E5W55_12515 [Mesorhizobium sp.]
MQTIGTESLDIDNVQPSEYVPILNRCAGGVGSVVGDDCSFLVDVAVTESYGYIALNAKRFLPLH